MTVHLFLNYYVSVLKYKSVKYCIFDKNVLLMFVFDLIVYPRANKLVETKYSNPHGKVQYGMHFTKFCI